MSWKTSIFQSSQLKRTGLLLRLKEKSENLLKRNFGEFIIEIYSPLLTLFPLILSLCIPWEIGFVAFLHSMNSISSDSSWRALEGNFNLGKLLAVSEIRL